MTDPIVPTMSVKMDVGDEILDMSGDPILDMSGDPIFDMSYVAVTNDLRRTVPITYRRGNFGTDIKDRVADIGTLKAGMDNSSRNSAGKIGYYSTDHENKRTGFGENTRVQIWFTYGAMTICKWQGKLKEIQPVTGLYNGLLTYVTAEDWMAEASRAPIKDLTVQIDKGEDQLLQALFDIMDNPPQETDLATGADTYPLAFHDERVEDDHIISIIQKIIQSSFGRFFLQGGVNSGEVAVFQSRQSLDTSTPVIAFDNSMVKMTPRRVAYKQIKKVVVVTYPVNVDTAATTVLYSSPEEISLDPGQEITFTGRYVNPADNSRCAGKDMVEPLVANTDFKFSSVSGSGNDLNGNLGITYGPHADSFDVTLKNNAGVKGYLWLFKVRGKGIYVLYPREYVAEDTTIRYGEELRYEMPYQNDFFVGKDIGDSILVWESTAETEVTDLEFIANRNDELMQAFMDVEPGKLVQPTETVSGISRTFIVNGVETEIRDQARFIRARLALTKIHLSDYLILDQAGRAELDTPAALLSP